MNKTSFTKIFFFFLLVGLEKINASSSTNLRKRKATTTTTSFTNALSSILMKEDWSCCDGTNEPTPVTVDAPTSSSTSPTLSVTSTPTTLRPTSIPTTSPTYDEKKITALDGSAYNYFGYSCSMSDELIVIGAPWLSGEGAYLYHLNGNQIKKLTPGDNGGNNVFFGWSVSVDEKVVVGTNAYNYVQVFSLEGEYERSITCDECIAFGQSVETNGDRVVISGNPKYTSLWNLYIYTIDGELLKTIDNENDWIYDVSISDDVIVFTTGLKTDVFSNTAPDFEKIVEIPQGGLTVATSSDRVVIGKDYSNNGDGNAWLYSTDGTFIKVLEHDGQYFGSSVDITDDKIIVGAKGDDEAGFEAGSVFIYSAATGDFQEKVFAPDGQANDYFGTSVCATDSYLVVGAPGEDDNGSFSGSAYLFPFSD